ncbi:acetyl-CoA C-acetyltransferase [Corynebacterium cystitidis]|uniref:acetyl-CoA C-acyltransferase n=1 Tax=Corynebacterium cystitidis DSM 20524 TaxID=1121357 RepID=A0A1H9SPW6_9CORY|nr:acetyl-CoA C-acetyltransferase [Corynebacterium cystitidis]WJY83132.1 putative acetyl-CoA acyltransferase [Corynebacterium cystitidis DSM 20524]SER87050.1 acetyl-CoA C-acetyltransferase [Corynebacterium cystitidis DSM 20524]SNV66614.1 acetyl-CoA acetyltransferase [Corynebacterium cystitidis]
MTCSNNPTDIVLCNPKRTPVGRYGGAFVSVPVQNLAVTVVKAVLDESGLQPGQVDDLILGQASPGGSAPALGRVVALDAGLGESVPGMQLDRRCGSGLQAVATAAAHISSGAADLIIAGGAESMSRTEYTIDADIRWGKKGGDMVLHDRLAEGREKAGGKNHPIPGGMIETAENLRRDYSIARDIQDEMAYNSHMRAAQAQEDGLFDDEIVPVSVPQRKGDPIVVDKDEHIRPETTLESLARLRPVMGRQDEEATVTAGNASGQNDGAAAMIVTTRAKAEELGLTPMVSLKGWSVAGVAPETMGIGPVAATEKLFNRLGLTFDDIDVIELNEAFAAQALACLDEWGISADDPRLNPQGSGISLGHPVGATGARMLVTASHRMARTDARRALVTMCIGGGQGLAAVIEKE